MLQLTQKGLYCPAGDFYIDPSAGVARAVVTHAHSDHARRGSHLYYSTSVGIPLLKERLGLKINTVGYSFREPFYIGPVKVSLHSAGHILGSAQVRLEHQGEVWVASGDYKREADPSCDPFEVVRCDTFVTEATFGTPRYRWSSQRSSGADIFDWWTENSRQGINSVLFVYSLGKTQRILAELNTLAERAIYLHPAAEALTNCYREAGVKLAKTVSLKHANRLQGDLILTPQSFLKTEQSHILGSNFRTAFASGWMATGEHRPNCDRGFVMSDHADWDDLLRTIDESEAKRVYVQHRGNGALVRHLRGLGIEAFPEEALMKVEARQLELF